MSGDEQRTAKGSRLITLDRKRGTSQTAKKVKRVARCPHCGNGLTIPLSLHYRLEADCRELKAKEKQ